MDNIFFALNLPATPWVVSRAAFWVEIRACETARSVVRSARCFFNDDLNRQKAPGVADESRFDAKIEDQDEIPQSSPDHEYTRKIEDQVR